MLNTNNPFLFASSSAADPLAPQDAVATAPGMPQSFVWMHLLLPFTDGAPVVPAAAAALVEAPAEAPPAESHASAEPAPAPAAAVPEAAAPVVAAIQAAVAAPAPALVTIAEPAPLPAPSAHFIPEALPADPAFDAYARLFQGIEDRDLLADLHATLAPGSDWANAFGPPLG